MSSRLKPTVKILVAGDGGVGKTSLLNSLCYHKYNENQQLTIGMQVFCKNVKIETRRLKLQIWDFGGQKQFREILDGFLGGSAGVILAFDSSSYKTFVNLDKWIRLLRKEDIELPIILVATKIDLGYHSMISRDLVERYVKKHQLIDFLETSAKEQIGIEKPFKVLLKDIINLKDEKIKFQPLIPLGGRYG